VYVCVCVCVCVQVAVAFDFAMAARLTKFFKIFDCGRFDNDYKFGLGLRMVRLEVTNKRGVVGRGSSKGRGLSFGLGADQSNANRSKLNALRTLMQYLKAVKDKQNTHMTPQG